MDFRSDGRVFSTGGPVESADTYTTDEDQLTITAGPQPDDTVIFRFTIEADTLILSVTDFNDPGCFLTTNLLRVN
ncbi:MAG: hypothetical protein HKN87_13135 [Saprospiraceae bacterium]|nr:hypothetical protein [Saprospiraceae bacterium]